MPRLSAEREPLCHWTLSLGEATRVARFTVFLDPNTRDVRGRGSALAVVVAVGGLAGGGGGARVKFFQLFMLGMAAFPIQT